MEFGCRLALEGGEEPGVWKTDSKGGERGGTEAVRTEKFSCEGGESIRGGGGGEDLRFRSFRDRKCIGK